MAFATVHPNSTGDIWEDAKAHIQRAEKDGLDLFWVIDIIGEYERVGADHLCLDFAGNDPESYALFVDEVMGKHKK